MSTPITREYLVTHCGYSELQVAAMSDDYVLDLFAQEYLHRSAMSRIAPEPAPASDRFAFWMLIGLLLATVGIWIVIGLGFIPKAGH